MNGSMACGLSKPTKAGQDGPIVSVNGPTGSSDEPVIERGEIVKMGSLLHRGEDSIVDRITC